MIVRQVQKTTTRKTNMKIIDQSSKIDYELFQSEEELEGEEEGDKNEYGVSKTS